VAGAMIVLYFFNVADSTRVIFHEEIFLIIPVGLYFLHRCGRGNHLTVLISLLLLFFYLAVGLLSQKFTGYITLIVFCIASALAINHKLKLTRYGKALRTLSYVYVSAFSIIFIVFVIINRETLLPSGNINFRFFTYGIALENFLESPLIGSMFTESSVITFDLFDVDASTQDLPTHSDILDVLQHGGMLGFLLFASGYVFLLKKSSVLLAKKEALVGRSFARLSVILVASILAPIVFAFNPVLKEPALATLVWFNFGLLLGFPGDNREAISNGQYLNQ
jgi:hypothetical protein